LVCESSDALVEGKTSNDFAFPQDVVKVGAVDADKHQSLGGQYGVQGFPTIKIFGANKNRPEDYQGKDFPHYSISYRREPESFSASLC
jgi:hypothetical protein